jgi:hypothetical protein
MGRISKGPGDACEKAVADKASKQRTDKKTQIFFIPLSFPEKILFHTRSEETFNEKNQSDSLNMIGIW